ncbi:hypothetical protein SISSUDRAFT_221582 [Sistotremastrum suecicum HHB10207 ss-3]|uniref:F-box domain-containing protein n=1 Tax=Sistotremastrum suecicum HHB10207 ss-3 TaxID=1314776 RepID=A0A166A5L4_9AGAM|nr:hypothetical protein SISSUDRAFT_221582 [Sistotremastrum suecicum HHB10207 ss-3]
MRCARFQDLAFELHQEILDWLSLDSIVNLAQTSYAFRRLILSNAGTPFLVKAYRKDPFPLPTSTSLNNPPSNFYQLCVHSVRLHERLSSADVSTALRPKKFTSIPLPFYPVVTAPYDIFVFRDILVLAHNTLMIVDMSAARFAKIALPYSIREFSCQMADDSSNLTAVITRDNRDNIHLYCYRIDVDASHFGEKTDLFDIALPPDMDVRECLIEDSHIFVNGFTDCIILNFRNSTGLYVQIDDIEVINRISAHPTLEHLVVEYRIDTADKLGHVLAVPIPTILPELFPENSVAPIWQTQHIAPPENALRLPDPNVDAEDLTQYNGYCLNSSRPRGKTGSKMLQIFHFRGLQIHSLLFWPDLWVCARARPTSENPPDLQFMDARGIHQWGLYSDAILRTSETPPYKIYVMLTNKHGDMRWVWLGLDLVVQEADQLWGFDHSLGRLFVRTQNELHIVHY